MSLEKDIDNLSNTLNLILYDIETTSEFGQTIYRVSVMHKDGITLDQCANLTHLISPLLDVNPPVSGDYRLEVSSPGMERKLKKLKHYELSLNELVKVTLLDGSLITGKLIYIKDKQITVNDNNEGEISFDFSNVMKARTYFEF
jgi:ribosome maturation factor RimP